VPDRAVHTGAGLARHAGSSSDCRICLYVIKPLRKRGGPGALGDTLRAGLRPVLARPGMPHQHDTLAPTRCSPVPAMGTISSTDLRTAGSQKRGDHAWETVEDAFTTSVRPYD
jgi:hypothetical protein